MSEPWSRVPPEFSKMSSIENGTLNSLGSLQTESRNESSSHIDQVSTVEICRIINDADSTVTSAIKFCLPLIARAIDLIADRVSRSGRVVYIGAGTSGRLAVLDASEIPPTFSAPYSQFIALIAGGDTAIRYASEGAEDSTSLAMADLAAISPPLTSLDTLIGVAASGRTPYVLAGLSHARTSLNMLTVGIACVKPSEMRGRCECLIECVTGAEIITGSTRMKAGTATKMMLNMISTGVMIRVGKTHGNMMIDVKSSNAKLIDRARRIFRTLLPLSQASDTHIDGLIASCRGSVKLALVVEKLGCSVETATARLNAAGGVLRQAWDIEPKNEGIVRKVQTLELVLCIDAGGTKCSAVIAGRQGILAKGEAGPCNFVTLGHDSALSTITTAVGRAISLLPTHFRALDFPFSPPFTPPIFSAAWIGGAGLDRTADLTSIHPRLVDLLGLPDPSSLIITNDAALLSSAIITRDHDHGSLASGEEDHVKTGVVLITGTGSVAFSYTFSPTQTTPIPTPLDRSGGYGYLLGDEGSGFYIGREAIRGALRTRDMGLPPTNLHKAIMAHFGCETVRELISTTYDPSLFRENPGGIDADPKLRVASVCPLVFEFAFPTSEGNRGTPDAEARGIVARAAAAAADVVIPLLRRGASGLQSGNSSLVLGGALGQIREFRELLVEELQHRGELFAHVEAVADVAGYASRLLVETFLDSPLATSSQPAASTPI